MKKFYGKCGNCQNSFSNFGFDLITVQMLKRRKKATCLNKSAASKNARNESLFLFVRVAFFTFFSYVLVFQELNARSQITS